VAIVDFTIDQAVAPKRRGFGQWLFAPEHSLWLGSALLGVWCLFLFFFGIGSTQFFKTESLRAIVAREFLDSGNWIVPKLYGEALFTKPPGMYAAIALCSLPFGEVTEWSARLPSALAATITVLMLFGYFSRVFGRRTGFLAALIIPMSPIWLDKASAAEIDMMQVMWVTGSILCLLRALEKVEKNAERPERSSVALGWWTGALLCVAGGFLTKWTAPAFFYATAIPLLWMRGRVRLLWSSAHLVAVAIGASLCLAWVGAAAASAGWSTLWETVLREGMQRVSPSWAPHTDAWWVFVLHPIRIWYTNLPWSLVALLACRPSFGRLWDERQRRCWQGLHCWIWPNLLIWSLMLDHKARHSFPLFPAIGGLAVMVVAAWLDGKLAWNWRVPPIRVVQTAMVLWLAAKLFYVVVVPQMPSRQIDRDPRGKGAILARLVPDGDILYLFKIKDEGIMFYYGREALRLDGPALLPASGRPVYCILAKAEWDNWRQHSSRPATALTEGLKDEQGAEMVLARVD
jgi:4-amino-4-deoxy-L-arabinose transferase-like glycosyltransferase